MEIHILAHDSLPSRYSCSRWYSLHWSCRWLVSTKRRLWFAPYAILTLCYRCRMLLVINKWLECGAGTLTAMRPYKFLIANFKQFFVVNQLSLKVMQYRTSNTMPHVMVWGSFLMLTVIIFHFFSQKHKKTQYFYRKLTTFVAPCNTGRTIRCLT